MTDLDEMLLEEAKRVRLSAYCPYSGFAVGAAVLAESGDIYGGCNIENSSFSLTNCAERTAIYHALSVGAKRFTAIAVVADTDEPVAPCGACRQVIAEFAIPRILLANLDGEVRELTLDELLPGAFSPAALEAAADRRESAKYDGEEEADATDESEANDGESDADEEAQPPEPEEAPEHAEEHEHGTI